MKKRKNLYFICVMIMVIMATTISLVVNAAEINYFYGVSISVKESGYSSGFILSSDIENTKDGGTKGVDYSVDKLLTYASEDAVLVAPQEIVVSIERFDTRFRAFVSTGGAESEVGADGTIVIGVPSATITFDLIIRSNIGQIQQRTTINVGFVEADSTRLFEGGNGTESDPFLISNADQLDRMRLFKHSHFKLTQNIDLVSYRSAGNDFNGAKSADHFWRGIGYSQTFAFGGTLDGDGHSIKNLQLSNKRLLSDGATLENGSLFNYIVGGEIKNLNFENANLTLSAGSQASSIVARNARDAKFSDINISGVLNTDVNGSAPFVTSAVYTQASMGRVMAENIISDVVVQNPNYRSVSGLFYTVSGAQDTGNVTDLRPVFDTLNVTTDLKAGSSNSGGIVGNASGLIMRNCEYTGTFTCGQNASYVGGLAGVAAYTDFDSCETDVIFEAAHGATTASYIGGIAGAVTQGVSALSISTIKNAAVEGNLMLGASSSYIGGIAGALNGRAVFAGGLSVELDAIKGNTYIGGISGLSSNNITVPSEAEIKIGSISGGASGNSFAGGLFGDIVGNLTAGSNIIIETGKISGASYLGGVAGRVSGAFEIGAGLKLKADMVQGIGYLGSIYGAAGTTFKLGADADISINAVAGTSNYIGGIGGDTYYTKTNAQITAADIAASTIGSGFKITQVSVSGDTNVGGFAGRFVGTLDFNGVDYAKTIVSATGTAGGFAGIFYGEIKNITLNSKVTITGSTAGGFAGSFEGKADNCNITSNITANAGYYVGGFAGGFAGLGSANTVKAIISSRGYMGGFAGNFTAAANTIYNTGALANTTVSADTLLTGVAAAAGDTVNYVGGFSGQMTGGTVNSVMVANGVVINTVVVNNWSTWLGGIIGNMTGGSITNTTSYANLTGRGDNNLGGTIGIGGMIGCLTSGSAGSNNKVFANITGMTTSWHVGGVIGYMGENGSIGDNNEYYGTISGGGSYFGGFIGRSAGTIGANNKTDAAIVSSAAYTGAFAGAINGGTVGWFEILNNKAIEMGALTRIGVIGYMSGGTVAGTSAKPIVVRNDIVAYQYGGGFVGEMAGGIIRYVNSYGKITVGNGYSGGFVGVMSGNALIEYCNTYSSSSVNPLSTYCTVTGGFVGYMSGTSEIRYSVSRGSVYVNGIGNYSPNGGFVAGLDGSARIGTGCASYGDLISIADSDMTYFGGFVGRVYASASVAGGTKAYGNVVFGRGPGSGNRDTGGGFVGINNGTIEAGCESYGKVTIGTQAGSTRNQVFAGSFAGINANGTIGTDCKAYGAIEAFESLSGTVQIGGFIGCFDGGTISPTCAYMGGSISGRLVGGFVGSFLSGTFDGSSLPGGYYDPGVAVSGTYGAGGFAYEVGVLSGGYYTMVSSLNANIIGVKVSKPVSVRASGSVGGIAGVLAAGKITKCMAESSAVITLNGSGSVGGIVGNANSAGVLQDARISGCKAWNNINAFDGSSNIGGLVGNINNISIGDNNEAHGFINVRGYTSYAGGFAGNMTGSGSNIGNGNKATGEVSVNSGAYAYYVGGFVGSCIGNIGDNNTAAGNVTAVSSVDWRSGYAGGFAGWINGTVGSGNTAKGNVSSQAGYAGGFAGYIDGTFNNFTTNKYLGNSVNGCYAAGYAGIIKVGSYDGATLAGGFYESKVNVTGSMGASGFVYDFSGAALRNIKISATIKASAYLTGYNGSYSSAGGLAAIMSSGRIENCETTNKTSLTLTTFGANSYTGGIVGQFFMNSNDGTDRIINCKAYVDIKSASAGNVGGIAAWVKNVNINNCETYGSIITTGTAGGLVGTIDFGVSVKNSTARVNIKMSNAEWSMDSAGGFAARNYGYIIDCSSYGDITSAAGHVGGFVARNDFKNESGVVYVGSIINCLSNNNIIVTANYSAIGGFAGWNNGNIYGSVALGTIRNEITGTATSIAGFVARGDSGARIKGCYTFVDFTKAADWTYAGSGAFISTLGQQGGYAGIINDSYYLWKNASLHRAYTGIQPFYVAGDSVLINNEIDLTYELSYLTDTAGVYAGEADMFSVYTVYNPTDSVAGIDGSTIEIGEAGFANLVICVNVSIYNENGDAAGTKAVAVKESLVTVYGTGATVSGVTLSGGQNIEFGEDLTISASIDGSDSGVIFSFVYSSDGSGYTPISLADLSKLIGVAINGNSVSFNSNIPVAGKFYIGVTATSAIGGISSSMTTFVVEPASYVTDIQVENYNNNPILLYVGEGWDLGAITVVGKDGDLIKVIDGYTITVTANGTNVPVTIVGNTIMQTSTGHIGSGTITIRSLGVQENGVPFEVVIAYDVYGIATGITTQHSVNNSNDPINSPAVITVTICDILNFVNVLSGAGLPADNNRINLTTTGKNASFTRTTNWNFDVEFTQIGTVVLHFVSADGIATKVITVNVIMPVLSANGISVGTYNFGDWSKTAVSLTSSIVIPAGCELQYDLGDGIWTKWTVNPVSISQNGSYNFSIRFKEISGNVFSNVVFVGTVNIDTDEIRESDIVYVVEHYGINAKIILKPIVSSLGATYWYSLNGNSFINITTSMKVEGLVSGDVVKLRIVKGNGEAAESQNIDIVINVGVTLSVNNGGYCAEDETGAWVTSDVAFYLTSSGNTSGIKYEYSLDGVIYTALNSGFYNATSSLTVWFKVINIFGSEDISGPYTVNIDKNIPAMSISIPSKSDVQSDTGFTTALTINNSPLSGITSLQMSYGGGSYQDINKDAVAFDKNGTYTIRLITGTGAKYYLTFNVDCIESGDIHDFNYTGMPNAGEWVDEVVLQFSTTSQNVASFEYATNGSVGNPGTNWTIITDYPYFSIKANGVYHFRATHFDNTRIILEANVTAIDPITPDMFIERSTSEWTHGGDAYINITSLIYGVSGIQSLTYANITAGETPIDIKAEYIGGKRSFEVWERGTYEFILTTNAGVIVTRMLDMARIDPSSELTLNINVESGAVLGQWTKNPFVIELWVTEAVLSPLTYSYSTDGGNTWKAITRFIGKTAIFEAKGNLNGTYRFKAETASGLVSISAEEYLIMVDSAEPVVKIEKDWKSKPGFVNIRITSLNTASGVAYTIYFSDNNGDSWSSEITAGAWYSIEIPAAGTKTYQFYIKTVLDLVSPVVEFEVGQDIVAPVLSVADVSVSYSSWIAFAQYELKNTNSSQLSGTIYQYALSTTSGEVIEEDSARWITINLSEAGGIFLIDFPVSGFIQFRAVSGVGLYSNIIEKGILMIDSLADCVVRDETVYEQDYTFTQNNVTLELEFVNGGSSFTSIRIVFPNGMTYTSFTPGQLSSIGFLFSLSVNENGTYKIYVTNGIDVTKIIEYTVNTIDRILPALNVTVDGTTGEWVEDQVSFRLDSAQQLSGVTYWYRIGDGEWRTFPTLGVLVVNTDTDAWYQFMARSGAGREAMSGTYHVMIDKGNPVMTPITGNRTEWGRANVTLVISATVSGSGGYMEYSLNLADWIKFGNESSSGGTFINNFESETNGTYYFRVVSNNGLKSDPLMEVINRIDKVIPVVMKNTAEGKNQVGENVTISAKDFVTYTVTKDSNEYSITIRAGEEVQFTENGTYIITFKSEGGNDTVVSFTIKKPNIALIVSMSAIGLIVAAIILILILLYVRQNKKLKRLIARSTVSDEDNKFVMFKRIK